MADRCSLALYAGISLLFASILGGCNKADTTLKDAEIVMSAPEINYTLSTDGEQPLKVKLASGDTVVLTQFLVTTFQVTLKPCPKSAHNNFLSFLIDEANAGHSFIKDPSELSTPMVIDLLDGGERTLGTASLGTNRYCSVRYLVGPSAELIAHQKTGKPDMENTSLFLEGELLDSEGMKKKDLLIRTGFSFDNQAPIKPGQQFDGPLHVHFSWKLSDVLEGIDFDNPSEKKLIRQLLQTFIGQQNVEFQ